MQQLDNLEEIIASKLHTDNKWYDERKDCIEDSLKNLTPYTYDEVHKLSIYSIDVPNSREHDSDFYRKLWCMVRGYFKFDAHHTKELMYNIPVSISDTVQQASELMGFYGNRDHAYESYKGAYMTLRYVPTALIGARGDYRYSGQKLEKVLLDGYDSYPVASFYIRRGANSSPYGFSKKLDFTCPRSDDGKYKWMHYVFDGNHRLRAHKAAIGVIPLITLEPFKINDGETPCLHLIPPSFSPPYEAAFDELDLQTLETLIKLPRNHITISGIRVLIEHGLKTQKKQDLLKYDVFKDALSILEM